MKTLKELNSKWYWRLVKIVFSLFILLVTIISYILVGDEVESYNPETFATFENENGNKERYERLKNLIKKYPAGIITQETIKKENIPASDLATLFAMGKEIEGQLVWGYVGEYNKEKCTFLFEEYLKELNQKGKVTEFPIHVSECGNQDAIKFKNIYDKFSDYFSSTDIEVKADLYKEITGEYIYKNYLGLFGMVKSAIASLLIAVTLIFVIRSITYYIIFGRIFPPK